MTALQGEISEKITVLEKTLKKIFEEVTTL